MKVEIKKGDKIIMELYEDYSILKFKGVVYKEEIDIMDLCTVRRDKDGNEVEFLPDSIIKHLYRISMRENRKNLNEFTVYLDYSFDF